ncbi:MAG: radical SAM protein [Acidobacteria bacterium]|nr:radical SAM protein [Acidobacteriota bacterium]
MFIRMGLQEILLVNPPIYDFTAYDFWLRPYGMLRVAGQIMHACRLSFFNYLNSRQRDAWGRGSFIGYEIPKPKPLSDIPRNYRRFGRPRNEFREFLKRQRFDAALIQTSMTYWYQGIQEAIEDIRELQPSAKIVLGGIYATLCPSHAESLGPDLVIRGADLRPLWQLLSVEPVQRIPYWPSDETGVGVIKITEGCPFRCTYCSAPLLWPGFSARPTAECLDELRRLAEAGTKNIAFYDDALLYHADRVLVPFLEAAIKADVRVAFHTPNALNARFVTPELARLMVRAGFAGFFFGLESSAFSWQHATGGKVYSDEFADAVNHLRSAGAGSITAYVIVGHPDLDSRDVELSITFAHQCGARVLLSEFSPIPGTIDGEKCRSWADLEEPLSHNKTAFAIRRLGVDHINKLKTLTHSLNGQLSSI